MNKVRLALPASFLFWGVAGEIRMSAQSVCCVSFNDIDDHIGGNHAGDIPTRDIPTRDIHAEERFCPGGTFGCRYGMVQVVAFPHQITFGSAEIGLKKMI